MHFFFRLVIFHLFHPCIFAFGYFLSACSLLAPKPTIGARERVVRVTAFRV